MALLLKKKPETAKTESAAPGQAPHKVHAKLRGRPPEKRTINLAAVNVQRINWGVGVPLIILVLAAVFAFGKFAVVDRLNEAAAAEDEVSSLHAQIDEGYRTIENFGEINDLYAHYTYSGMSQEELERVNRVEMMQLIKRVVLPAAPVDNWSVSGNQMTLDIEGRTLQEINQIVQKLLAEDIVDFCTVSTASTNQNRDFKPRADETVTATVVVQFKNLEREAQS